MKIEETIQKIENWVQENKLDLLLGIAKGKSVTKVLCDADLTDILEFLDLGKKTGAKIFIMYKSFFQIEDVLNDSAMNYEEDAEQEIQIKMLEKYEGRVEFISISWLSNNAIFEYFDTADWREEVKEIKINIVKLNKGEVHERGDVTKESNLSQAEIKEIAKLVAEHCDFFANLHNYNKTGTILSAILEQKEIQESALGFSDKSLIQTEARAYFDRYLLSEREKEMIEKIVDLKNQNLPKVVIRSKLGISERMLNKYY